ncbi:MAG: sulfotransferase [Candidatus Latescibacterota bacterium]|nr:MAG: sulfotransferase [Candidatus Latescibacterota bacterium]
MDNKPVLKTIHVGSPGILRRIVRGARSLTAKIHPAPIIVLGNQKSGTTAIAALLAEATGLAVTLDLEREFTDPVIDRIKTGGMSMEAFVKRNRLDFSRDVIKEPSLSVFFPELVAYFPDARFVMVIRDPRDNIRSILNRLKIPGTTEELTDSHRSEITRAWDLIVDGSWLGLAGANFMEMLAQRWNYIADSYRENPDQMNLLRYESFLKDKMGEISRLAHRLGLETRHDISHRVDHQFQPAGDRDVNWLSFFGPVNLARIETICRERMRVFDYAPSI